MLGKFRHGWRAEGGAIAPTAALSLFALVAAGGIAFDYARLASLDTELQQAADQAALAAATQLDGQTGAMARAEAAARSLVVNQTLFGNDNGGLTAAVAANPTSGTNYPLTFYATRGDAEGDTNGWTAASTDVTANSAARFVRVKIAARQARYALTPIVGAIASGDINAEATAGLGSSICKVPPVMMCNPDEPVGNLNEQLPYAPVAGEGLKLITGNAEVPGNFGWLEAGLENGAPALGAALGYNSPPGDCQPVTGVTTKTGMTTSVLDALNTRFDVFSNGNMTCPSQAGGVCSPARNTRKDLVCAKDPNAETCNGDNWNAMPSSGYRLPTTPVCTRTNNQGVCTQTEDVPQAQMLPTDGSSDPAFMGYPRDLCHALPLASQTCGTRGSGQWDRNAYFRVNYGWDAATWPIRTGLNASNATRWQVYQWELANPMVLADGTACTSVTQTGCRGIDIPQNAGGNDRAFSRPATGRSAVTASSSQADRRRLTVAALNCRALGLNGKSSNIAVPTWVDVFLVEPSLERRTSPGNVQYTDQKDVYVEVIGVSAAGGAGGVGQVVRRDVPYLIR